MVEVRFSALITITPATRRKLTELAEALVEAFRPLIEALQRVAEALRELLPAVQRAGQTEWPRTGPWRPLTARGGSRPARGMPRWSLPASARR